MRSLFFSLLLLVALFLITAPAFAQQGNPLYPVERGERVRVTQASTNQASGYQGPFYVGSVFAADGDSISVLLNDRDASVLALAWSDIKRVERLGENRTGEALGLIIGGVGGTLAGYALADILSESSLAGVGGAIFGGLGGLLVGGVVGAHIGDRWKDVSPVRTTSAFRVVVPLR